MTKRFRCSALLHRSALGSVLGMFMAGCQADVQDMASEPDAEIAIAAAELGVVPAEAQRISNYLQELVDPATVHATVRYGDDIIDCVDALEQPAMRALRKERGRDVELPKPPALGPQGSAPEGIIEAPGEVAMRGRMTFPKCPGDSVPIRRIPAQEILEYGSLDAYLRRPSPMVHPPQVAGGSGYRYTKVDFSGANFGMEAKINLWNNQEVASGDHTVSQIFVTRGEGSGFQTVEAGWVKRPGQSARLFVFTTNDNYNADRCWNTTCFSMQPGSPFTLDVGWDDYSVMNGNQFENTMLLYKDGLSGDWWLRIDGSWVGHWSRGRFANSGLRLQGNYIGSQGEVFQSASSTITDMGSGRHASEWSTKAAYQRGLQWVDTNNLYRSAASFGSAATHSSCYSIIAGTESSQPWLRYFFFGGPSC